MKDRLAGLLQSLGALKGLLYFLLLAALVIAPWKFFELDSKLYSTLYPVNRFMILFESPVNYFLVNKILGIESTFSVDTIRFSNGQSMIEDPLCTGLKQIIQFTIIMLLYHGPFRHKLWYLPLSWVVLIISAILHLTLLSIVLAKTPQHYDLFHAYISRWFFFAVFFILWVFWEERYVKQNKLSRNIKPEEIN